MKNEFLLRKEFMLWLTTIGEFPILSAKSYCSYVAAADKTIILVNAENHETNLFAQLEPLVRAGKAQIVDIKIIDVINILSKENIDVTLNAPISSIQKWRSGLFQYREFLYHHIETEIETEIDVDDEIGIETDEVIDSTDNEGIILNFDIEFENNTGFKYIHSKQDLFSNFRFRLITQDRVYSDIYYPISFIKRYLYLKGEKDFLDTWVKDLLNNVTVYIEDGTVKLNQISKLEISNNKVFVDLNGSLKLVYTKKSDNNTLVPFSVKKLREIALDHGYPLIKIMYENLDQLKAFQEITKELKKNISRKVTPKKLKKASNIVLKSDFINLINIEILKAEMTLISTLTNLQLMDSRENTSKGQK